MREQITLMATIAAPILLVVLMAWHWLFKPWAEDIDRRWRELHKRRALLAINLAPHSRDCPKSDDPSDWARNLPSGSCVCHIHDLREFTHDAYDNA